MAMRDNLRNLEGATQPANRLPARAEKKNISSQLV